MARVLIVDDIANMRTLMRMSLERGSHEVVEAVSGLQALEHLQSMRFDIVIVDIIMPDLDGFAVCRAVRAAPERLGHALEILMVSAEASETEAKAAGADRFLLKPFSPSVLLNLVNELAPPSQACSSSPSV